MNKTFLMRSGYDGVDISVLVCAPDTEPVAVLQLAHGMRGYKDRFLPLMEYLSDHGVACVANDHRGHGMSVKHPSDRGYMYSGGHVALVEDMKMVTEWARSVFPGVPVFLLGHSMGSLAAGTYLKVHDDLLDGLILCGTPGYNPLAPAAQLLFRLLSMINDGRMRMGGIQSAVSSVYNRRFRNEGSDAWICANPRSRVRFLNNPLCSFDFTANAMHALMCLMRERYSDDGWMVMNPDVHIYFISGEDDPMMRGESGLHDSAIRMKMRGYSDVTSAIYSGMRHEVLNEVGKEKVWEDILEHIRSWI